jgi:hypothetical protein
MTRRELIQLLVTARFSSRRLGTTALPFTYVIDYSIDHLDNPAYIRKVAAAPPNLLHLGLDTPFWGRRGPVRQVPNPGGPERAERIGPEETRKKTASITRMVGELKRVGVDVVIPYICNQTLSGDADKRLGFWEFYDHWDDYLSFGLPPRPAADPIKWLQEDPKGNPHYNYRLAHKAFTPLYRYAPCPNNEYWDLYLRFVVERIAGCGYDGVFVDNNILHCYCRYCRKEFRRYLAWRYTPAALRRNFGTPSVEKLELNWRADKSWFARQQAEFRDYILAELPPDQLEREFAVRDIGSVKEWNRLGNGFLYGRGVRFVSYLQDKYPAAERRRRFGMEDLLHMGLETAADRLLWMETQRFWAWSIAENLLRLEKAGRRYRSDFLVLPNWGELGTVSGAVGRSVDGKNVTEWSRGCKCLMFEEDVASGRTSPETYKDRLLEYRYAFANGVSPAILAYGKDSASLIDLAHAEAAAGGGGAYVQVHYGFPEIRRRYRAFFERHPELFVGLEPYAQVALILSFAAIHMGDHAHFERTLEWTKRLGKGHFLFHVLDGDRAGQPPLSSFAHVIQTRGSDSGTAPPANLAVTDRRDIPGLRATAYWKRESGRARIVIHLVNYEVTELTEAAPVRHLTMSVPLPAGAWRLEKLRQFEPGDTPESTLQGSVENGRLRFGVSEIRAYKALEATLETPSKPG